MMDHLYNHAAKIIWTVGGCLTSLAFEIARLT